jgi:preprotein translocase subunit YajC
MNIFLLQSSGGGGIGPLIFLPLMILVFWLFFIRPQAKKAKNQKNFVENLQKGDKVVTIAGIHGVINKVNEDGRSTLKQVPVAISKLKNLPSAWIGPTN